MANKLLCLRINRFRNCFFSGNWSVSAFFLSVIVEKRPICVGCLSLVCWWNCQFSRKGGPIRPFPGPITPAKVLKPQFPGIKTSVPYVGNGVQNFVLGLCSLCFVLILYAFLFCCFRIFSSFRLINSMYLVPGIVYFPFLSFVLVIFICFAMYEYSYGIYDKRCQLCSAELVGYWYTSYTTDRN